MHIKTIISSLRKNSEHTASVEQSIHLWWQFTSERVHVQPSSLYLLKWRRQGSGLSNHTPSTVCKRFMFSNPLTYSSVERWGRCTAPKTVFHSFGTQKFKLWRGSNVKLKPKVNIFREQLRWPFHLFWNLKRPRAKDHPKLTDLLTSLRVLTHVLCFMHSAYLTRNIPVIP